MTAGIPQTAGGSGQRAAAHDPIAVTGDWRWHDDW